jgi:HTH-type transcriptional regulator / antitoxin HipB
VRPTLARPISVRMLAPRQATISNLENGEGGTLASVFRVLTVLKLDMKIVTRATSQPDLDDIF